MKENQEAMQAKAENFISCFQSARFQKYKSLKEMPEYLTFLLKVDIRVYTDKIFVCPVCTFQNSSVYHWAL